MVLLCAALISTRSEPGGNGLVLDAFLINGGDGFYQKGVPWGDPDFVSGKKGEAVKTERKIKEKRKKKKEPKAEQKRKADKAEKNKNAALLEKKAEKTKASENITLRKSGRGTETRAYGGAVGDAPGFGSGTGMGIGVGGGNGVGDLEAARYFVKLRRLLQRRLKYPESADGRRRAGKAVVRFYLEADGKIDPASVVLAASSGSAELDERAIRTVAELPKLSEPPRGAMTIEIPVVFRVYH